MNENISDIMRTSGREKWRLLAAKGAATFLMLDGGPTGNTDRSAGSNEEGVALAAMAGDIYGGLPRADRDAWPGGVALALQMLADRSFFPPVEVPAGTPRGADEPFRALAEGRYVRVVNFHATPRRISGGLEEQLTRLAENFAPVSYEDLAGLLVRGEWPHHRPGVIVSFFDGFRDNFEVAAPMLDRLGLTGWFFLVSGWLSTPPDRQCSFARERWMDLPYDEHELPADGRLALSPEEVSSLADRGHVIASHTRTHFPTSPDPTPEALAREAVDSRRELEAMTGGKVRALAWYAGMALGDRDPADVALRNAGYDLLFANHAVQRVR